MANYLYAKPFIIKHEGGYTVDTGGATNMGITLTTYRQYYGNDKTIKDLKNITNIEWNHIFKIGYWDKISGDRIVSQSVANAIVDYIFNCGLSAIRRIQKILNVTVDGIVGENTINKINGSNSEDLFIKIQHDRIDYYYSLVALNKNKYGKYLKGWIKRVTSMRYEG